MSAARRAGLHAGRVVCGTIAAAALALASLGSAGAPAEADKAHRPARTVAASAATPFQRGMAVSMARMMRDMHALSATGDADSGFLAMMIPHHAGAVDMARLVLQHGRDPATRQLAEEIIAGQTVEIESMTRRLAALRRGPAAVDAKNFPALGGTCGP